MAGESIETVSVWDDVAARTSTLATEWVAALRGRESDVEAEARGADHLLEGLRRDPESFEFTRRLLELVAGTDDAFASALGLHAMAREVPESMPVRDRLAVRAGGATSLGLPWAVMPVARKWLRDRVSGLVLATKLPTGAGAGGGSGRLAGLADGLRKYSDAGLKPVIEPLGDAVHGPAGAAAEAARLAALAAHPTVGHLVVDVTRIAPGGSDWSYDADVARAAAALEPVLRAAADHGTTVHLTARTVRWARMLPDIAIRATVDPALDRARIGVRLLAELPESREYYGRLSRWAQRRVADGGAPAEVTIGVGGVAGTERIASIASGLAVPVLEDPTEVTAQLLRLIELALHPGRAAVLRPVIASEDLLALAGTVALTEHLGARGLAALQVRSGVAPGLASALRAADIEVRVAIPVVAPKEFGGAVDLLVAVAAEAADPESPLSRLEALIAAEPVDDEPPLPESSMSAALRRFAAAAELAADPAPSSHRTQVRAREWDPSERDSALFYRSPDEPSRFDTGGLTAAVLGLTRGAEGAFALEALAPPRAIPVVSDSGFANEPGTDATVAANREWVRELLTHAAASARQVDDANATIALARADLDPQHVADEARSRAEAWSAQPHRTRASRLRRAALAMVAARDRLIQALVVDTGAPPWLVDAEVDTLIDAARYSGQLAEGLGAVRGATFVPDCLVLVVADAATPLAIQAESVFAALAAGSGVLWSVPAALVDSAAAVIEECEVGGLTPGVVRLEATVVGRTVAELAAHPGIDRAVVLGARSDALELARRRPDLRVEGRFRARGTTLVTPSADLDRAIDDIVASAFGAHPGDPRAARGVVLLGSVARSRRFRDGLADAVRAITVVDSARPSDADALDGAIGPLIAAPDAAGLRALTELGRGESWLVQPRRLDDAGRLWSPGVRLGVSAASTFWDDSRAVPVIGIATAHSLSEAIAVQNAEGSGGVAALQSHDADEIADWLESVEAAALAVNRPTTGALIERHPGGGWNDAGMGLAALAGGPHRLVALGAWRPREGSRSETLHLRGLDAEVQLLIEAAQADLDYAGFDALRRAALADALTWRTSFGVDRDVVGLGVERNVLRHRAVPTHIRLAEGGAMAHLVRVIAAALLVQAPVTISTGEVLPAGVAAFLERRDIEVSLERDDDWVERLAVTGPVGANGEIALRVRLIDGDRVRAAEWLGGQDRVAIWGEPVTMAGPVELLTLLREQAVSVRAHRHGLAVPVPGLDAELDD
ncbi:proline dehydrogenase family protein [Leucobacter japonicus]|uniref:proline dehydrogenase family protein n=1 Tax=Leucobacter japonicus TaxID=1461259 RepID=UPI0009E43DCC|nr:proline dehydrogenase family protein [Leucobacter japonicus]